MVCLDNVPFINMFDCWILYHSVTSLENKFIFWNVVFLVKVIKFLRRHFHVFGSSLHCAGKCMAKLYAAYIAGAWQSLRKNRSLNCHLISNSVIQVHSFCLVRYYAGFTLVIFRSYGRKSRRTRFLFDKNNRFRFSFVQSHASECMIQSTNI